MFEESPFAGICGNATLEVILMLVGTFLLGLLLGYLLWGWLRSKLKTIETENLRLKASLQSAYDEIEIQKTTLAEQQQKIEDQSGEISVLTTTVTQQSRELAEQEDQLKSLSSQTRALLVHGSALIINKQTPVTSKKSRSKKKKRYAGSASRSLPDLSIPELDEDDPSHAKSKGVSEKSLKKAAKVFKREIAANDLTIIEGIGPVIAELLNKSGIRTWELLSNTKPMVLRVILDEGGGQFRPHKPKSWPRQAKMAASGEWKKLKAYQEKRR